MYKQSPLALTPNPSVLSRFLRRETRRARAAPKLGRIVFILGFPRDVKKRQDRGVGGEGKVGGLFKQPLSTPWDEFEVEYAQNFSAARESTSSTTQVIDRLTSNLLNTFSSFLLSESSPIDPIGIKVLRLLRWHSLRLAELRNRFARQVRGDN
jgi:hypothetical protein